MRLLPFPRRHRILWLAALVVGVSACGSWLTATGRTPGYGSSFDTTPADPIVDENAVAELRWIDQAELTSAIDDVPTTSATPDVSAGGQDAVHSVDAPVTVDEFDLVGFTDPVAFATAVATTVLTDDPSMEFSRRVDAVMAVAALPPIGSPADLRADLTALDSNGTPGAEWNDRVVSFTIAAVARSTWGTARINQLHLPKGSFAIDVTGHQLIHVAGHEPISVPVSAGITGACPPALAQCELDRVFPRTVAAELGP